ncbi:MAG: hypothetical protein QM831_07685 [Kofleriaceae bacterium]
MSKLKDWLPIAGLILFALGGLAVVAINVRQCVAKRDAEKHGWNVQHYLDEAIGDRPDAQLYRIAVEYVDADGNAWLDMDSTFSFEFAKRGGGGPHVQLGARAAKPDTCGIHVYIHHARTQLSSGLVDGPCDLPDLPPLRCKVTDVWKRAIALGAPANALARIDLDHRTWRFEIVDREHHDKVVFTHEWSDDC